jgi:hypothetical protein
MYAIYDMQLFSTFCSESYAVPFAWWNLFCAIDALLSKFSCDIIFCYLLCVIYLCNLCYAIHAMQSMLAIYVAWIVLEFCNRLCVSPLLAYVAIGLGGRFDISLWELLSASTVSKIEHVYHSFARTHIQPFWKVHALAHLTIWFVQSIVLMDSMSPEAIRSIGSLCRC